jgi:hypothetical protein
MTATRRIVLTFGLLAVVLVVAVLVLRWRDSCRTATSFDDFQALDMALSTRPRVIVLLRECVT